MAVKVTSKIIKDLDPNLIDKLRKRFGASSTPTVNVGFPATGEQHKDSEMNVASVADVHEFGSETVPERSFLRVAIRRNRQKYLQMNRINLAKVARGDMDVKQALGMLGEEAKGDVQMEITNGEFAPLAPTTVKAKGSSEPLVDSGQMKQSVAWEYGDE